MTRIRSLLAVIALLQASIAVAAPWQERFIRHFADSLPQGRRAESVKDVNASVDVVARAKASMQKLVKGVASAQLTGDVAFDNKKGRIAICRGQDAKGRQNSLAYWAAAKKEQPLYLEVTGCPAKAGASEEDALSFVKDELEIGKRTVRIHRFGRRLGAAQTVIKGQLAKREYLFPFDSGWFFLVDGRPYANWSHPCRYVFVSEDLSSYVVLYTDEPAKVLVGGQQVEMREEMLNPPKNARKTPFDPNSVRAALTRRVADNGLSYEGDTSHSYALVISGGSDSYWNWSRYWGDVVMIYSTLRLKYKLPKNHITVCMSDGTSSDSDMHIASDESYMDSPRDLDGDGSEDVNYDARRDTIKSAVQEFADRLTESDQLFVFITDHGSDDWYGGSYVVPWESDNISTSDLSDWLSGIKAPVAVAMETCYSGGFVDPITDTSRVRAVATACRGDEPSSAFCWSDPNNEDDYEICWEAFDYCNPWAWAFTTAIRGCSPAWSWSPWEDGGSEVTCQVDVADKDGDGRVSFREAASCAESFVLNEKRYSQFGTELTFCDTPQYGESQTGAGSSFFVVKQGDDPVPPPSGGTYYAQFAGINNFEYGWQGSLSYCVSDVNHMYEAATEYGNWLPGNVVTLTESSATESAIRSGVQALAAKAVAGDTVLFHHSAHGNSNSVCCYDEGGSYDKWEMAEDLGRFKSGVKVVVVVDACESGGLFKSVGGLSLGEEVRAIMREKQRQNGWTKGNNPRIDADEIGWITAADEYHSSYDNKFTPMFCEGWTTGDADEDEDGKINFYELYEYAKYAAYGYYGDDVIAQYCNKDVLETTWARGGEVDPERPENDDFADAIELWDDSGYEYGSNVGATTEPGEPDHAGYGSKKTVWWTWTAPNEGIVGIDVWGDPYSGFCYFDTALAVYTGDSLAALELVCYSSGSSGVHVSFQAVAGETYHIAVCGKGDAEGSFDLNWNLEPLVQEFGDWQYKIYDSEYASVVGYVGTATTLEVPETLGGYPVTEIGIWAFKGNENLTDVVLPKYCREILSGAFADCINLSTLRISFHDENENDNWISITDYSLYNCPNLTVRVNSDVEIVPAGYEFGCAVTASFVREGYSGSPRWFSRRGGMGDELTISTEGWFSDTWVAWSYWDGTPEPIDLGPGEWTSDVDAVKEAAQKNGRMIAIEWGRLSTCIFCQALEPHITSAQFLTWAKENGVYLVSADDSKFDDVEAAQIWFSSCFEGNMIDFPTIVFIDASDLETCLGQGLFRNGQTVGEIQYENTVESLIECFEQFLPDPPPPPDVDTKGEVVLGQDGAAKTSATYYLGGVMCTLDSTELPEWVKGVTVEGDGLALTVHGSFEATLKNVAFTISAEKNTGKERSSDWKIKNDAGAVVFTLTIRQQGSSEPLPPVQDPVLDPASQAFEGEEFTVNCTCADAEAEIRYTIGAEPADPTEGDALWPADGLLITEESIVKVRAFMAGREPSGVVTGDYTCHSCEPTEGNDDFANAEEIAGLKGSTTCSSVRATFEVGEPRHYAGCSDATVWWKWTATSDGPMTVDTKGSSFDTVMAVYTGTDVSHLTLVGNNDDAEGDDIADDETWSRVVFEAVEGETYSIVVAGSRYDEVGEGEVKLNWAFGGEDPQPVEEFYTIRFESGDEAATGEMEELQAKVGKFVKLPQNKFALEGKYFDGWYCAETEKKYGDAFEVLDLAEADQTATLVAQWRTKKKPEAYDIVFASGEGEGAVTQDPVTVGVGMTYWLGECPFKGEEGQTFIGWLCLETGEVYEDRDEIIDLAKDGGTVTLVAQWEGGQAKPDFYTIVFAPGEGGTGTMAPMQVQTNAAVKLSKCAFVNKNPAVAFAEWKSDAGKTYKDEQEVRDLAKVGETVTLTAQWGCAPFSQLDDGLSEDEKKDVSIGFAAYVYDGHLVATNDDNSVVGVVTVKVDKKGKTTATVTRIGVTKLTYKSQMPIAKGEVDLLCTKDSAKMHLTVYAGGIEGSCGPYQVTCRKNVAKENPAGYMAVEGKVWAVALKADELTATDLTSGYASLTVTGAKKGKVKVIGMLPDGTKVSASSQAEVKADGGVLIPIVAQLYSGKIGGISLALQIDGKKGSESAAEVRGAGKWKSLTGEIPWDSSQSHCEPVNVYGITRKTDMFTLEKQPAQIAGMNVATQFLHSVSNMMFSGKKWMIAKGGKIKLMGTDIVDMNASPNPGGLTLSYTPKTGAFKGKYSVYANNFGKLKKLSATVNGVIVGENGYGTAVIKQQHSIPVQIQNQK